MVNTQHILTNPNQISRLPSLKKQILLAHTSSTIDEYFTKITTRWYGDYDGSFTFTIGLDGTVYQHYNPQFYTNLFHIPEIDSQIISIGLENAGWLQRDPASEDFFDWKGSIYKGVVVGRLWRSHNLWARYTDEQVDATVALVQQLVDEYKIRPAFSGGNLPLEDAKDFNGVLTRSNYFKFYYDLSPAFDFNKLNEMIK